MRTLMRVGIILMAAMLVVVGMFAFRQTELGQSIGQRRPGFERAEGRGFDQGAPPAGFERERAEGGRGERRGGGLFAAGELIKNLVVMLVITFLVVMVSYRRRAPNAPRPAPAE
jgi:hypothetical protein